MSKKKTVISVVMVIVVLFISCTQAFAETLASPIAIPWVKENWNGYDQYTQPVTYSVAPEIEKAEIIEVTDDYIIVGIKLLPKENIPGVSVIRRYKYVVNSAITQINSISGLDYTLYYKVTEPTVFKFYVQTESTIEGGYSSLDDGLEVLPRWGMTSSTYSAYAVMDLSAKYFDTKPPEISYKIQSGKVIFTVRDLESGVGKFSLNGYNY